MASRAGLVVVLDPLIEDARQIMMDARIGRSAPDAPSPDRMKRIEDELFVLMHSLLFVRDTFAVDLKRFELDEADLSGRLKEAVALIDAIHRREQELTVRETRVAASICVAASVDVQAAIAACTNVVAFPGLAETLR